MRKILFVLIIITIPLALYILFPRNSQKKDSYPMGTVSKKPFDKYTIENLSKTQIEPGEFTVTTKLAGTKDFVSNVFNFRFKPDLNNFKNTSGQVNLPNKEGYLPLVLMIRGYVDQSIYKTGNGTKNAAKYFAENGFITVSPDFLGYAKSDSESGNIFETRFQTYVTVLALLNSISELSFAEATKGKWDGKNIFIWAHSNGGQIAVTSLEISGKNFPTTLWAPVTKPFPYSILYYTDESGDGGKLIRKELSKFEDDYDTDLYSLTKYLDRLLAPIQINQGTDDDAVPVIWSHDFTKILRSLNKEVFYNEFQGNDHNMRPDWNDVIEMDLKFFNRFLTD